MKKGKKKELDLIGRREKIDFPDLELFNIDAKIDTGAYSNSLHCDVVRIENIKEKKKLIFIPLGPKHKNYKGKEIVTKKFSIRRIRNSFGNLEKRYVIQTRIVIGNRIIKTDITLSDRIKMKYPVLIGRKMLNKKFLIDVSRINFGAKKKP